MKRTAIYCRVSTDQQAKEGDSIPAQLDALRKYIEEHDELTPAGEYIDAGESGTKENRDELQRMLSDVRAGKIDLILVTKMDRLHRSLRNFLNMQDVLDGHNCNWRAIWEPMYDTATPQGRMIINTMMNLAQFEAENTGSRIRQVFAHKVKQGEVLTGATPTGYSIVNKRLEPNDDADTVRQAFALYIKENTLASVVRFMRASGCKANLQTARNMLKNTLYIGEYRGNTAYCPPIIDRETFAAVQTELARPIKNNRKHDYIFPGLIRCSACGCALGAATMYCKRNGKLYPSKTYKCPKHRALSYGGCDNNHSISERKVEKWLLDNVVNLHEEYVIECKKKQSAGRRNAQKGKALTRKLERLKEAYLNDVITLAEYKADRARITEELAVLDAVQAAQPVSNVPVEKIFTADLKTLYDGFSANEKRFFWRSILKEIRWSEKRELSVIFL